MSTAHLTNLPVELVTEIGKWLDNRVLLELGLAWRPFLHHYTPSMDPWNPKRIQLKRACRGGEPSEEDDMDVDGDSASEPLDDDDLFQVLLRSRFVDLQEAERDQDSIPVGLFPDMDLEAFYAALTSFLELDAHPPSVVRVYPLYFYCDSALECMLPADVTRGWMDRPAVFREAIRLTWEIDLDSDTSHSAAVMRVRRQSTHLLRALRETDALYAVRGVFLQTRGDFAQPLADAVAANTSLHHLSVSYCDLPRAAMDALALAVRDHPTLKDFFVHPASFDMDTEGIGQVSLDAMRCLFQSKLERISLLWVSFLNADWSELTTILRQNKHLRTVALNHTGLDELRAYHLFQGLMENPALEGLELIDVGLGYSPAVPVPRSAGQPGNLRRPSGTKALLDLLKTSKSLQRLNIGSNHYPRSSDAFSSFAIAFVENPSPKLRYLDLGTFEMSLSAARSFQATVQRLGFGLEPSTQAGASFLSGPHMEERLLIKPMPMPGRAFRAIRLAFDPLTCDPRVVALFTQ